jgi:hypothetical protein
MPHTNPSNANMLEILQIAKAATSITMLARSWAFLTSSPAFSDLGFTISRPPFDESPIAPTFRLDRQSRLQPYG